MDCHPPPETAYDGFNLKKALLIDYLPKNQSSEFAILAIFKFYGSSPKFHPC